MFKKAAFSWFPLAKDEKSTEDLYLCTQSWTQIQKKVIGLFLRYLKTISRERICLYTVLAKGKMVKIYSVFKQFTMN